MFFASLFGLVGSILGGIFMDGIESETSEAGVRSHAKTAKWVLYGFAVAALAAAFLSPDDQDQR